MEIPLGEVVHVIDDFDARGAEFAHVTFKGVEGWAADLDENSYRERRRRLLRSLNDDAN